MTFKDGHSIVWTPLSVRHRCWLLAFRQKRPRCKNRQLSPAPGLSVVLSGRTNRSVEGAQCFERSDHLFASCEIGCAGLLQDFSGQRVIWTNEHDWCAPCRHINDQAQARRTHDFRRQDSRQPALPGALCWLIFCRRSIQYSGSRWPWAIARIQTVSPVRR